MAENSDRWRVECNAVLSIVIHGTSREGVLGMIEDLLFEQMTLTDNPFIETIEIRDVEDAVADPEPLCKGCGRLPECCDCDEDDE